MEPDLVQRNVVVDTVSVTGEDVPAEPDEPPEPMNQHTPRPISLLSTNLKGFTKTSPPVFQRKESLLTQALHLSEVESPSEEEPPLQSSRDSSSSDADLTSSGTRTHSPSPPLPSATFRGFAPVFSKPDFSQTQLTIRMEEDHIDPHQKPSTETTVEANLGRKRCITFACGRKNSPPTKTQTLPKEPERPAPVKRCSIRFACPSKVSPTPTKVQTPPKEERPVAVKRCSIRFACPSKVSTEQPSQERKPKPVRSASPAPALLRKLDSQRTHRDSDSTVRDDSPRSAPKSLLTLHARKQSTSSDLERYEATRFHAFASSEEEVDDWTQESTCHRSRLTISDTLKVENGLRKLGEEAEEEALEEEEAALEDDDEDNDDEDLDEDEDDDDNVIYEVEESSDDGFKTDNEAGFASSDDESDAGSEYDWWAPGAGPSTAATSADYIDSFRPSARRSFSDSSVGSPETAPAFLSQFKRSPSGPKRRRRRPIAINTVSTPELPDSTDFVCGTLDEDRPLEEAYASAIEKKRAAKHRFTPQDIDPTFPTSDPELDEEEEEDDHPVVVEESDQHPFVHGSLDSIDGVGLRGRKTAPTPKRLRSPPPISRRGTAYRSPPPRRSAGTSPKRVRSPPPASRRPSFITSPPTYKVSNLHFVGMAQRPQLTIPASLPRTPVTYPVSPILNEEDSPKDFPSRGAIDIKAGLEQKRQRRKEKLYQKHCRKQQKEGEKRRLPGKGAERMREIGLEIAAYAKGKRAAAPAKDALMLSI